jgi:hypothetical protein
VVLLGTWGTNWEQINHRWESHDVPPNLNFFFLQQVILITANYFKKKKHWTFPQKKFAFPKGNSLNIGYERSSLGKDYGINPLLAGVFIYLCIN